MKRSGFEGVANLARGCKVAIRATKKLASLKGQGFRRRITRILANQEGGPGSHQGQVVAVNRVVDAIEMVLEGVRQSYKT